MVIVNATTHMNQVINEVLFAPLWSLNKVTICGKYARAPKGPATEYKASKRLFNPFTMISSGFAQTAHQHIFDFHVIVKTVMRALAAYTRLFDTTKWCIFS